ncbi:MAG: phosphatase PAP2 family protein [Saprospiraceae bacterium]|nr:phosphatase PAP2 family protein [Saprospiraceae bacterium]
MISLRGCLIFICVAGIISASAQVDTSYSGKDRSVNRSLDFRGSVYETHKVWTPIIVAVGTALNYSGLATLEKEEVTLSELQAVNKDNVNGFDRGALRQSVSQRFDAGSISDAVASLALFSPALLMLDRKIRADWLEVALVSMEGILLGANLFAWGPARFVDRLRPIVYYEDISFEERVYKFNRNSFFSGHVAWAASAAYTSATIYSDYHPEASKWWIYGLASIPPTVVGYYRYRALKHYPSDIILGHLVGLATGLLVPHLHKRGKKRHFTLAFSDTGVGMVYRKQF